MKPKKIFLIIIIFILILSVLYVYENGPKYIYIEGIGGLLYLDKLEYSLKLMTRYHIDEAFQGVVVIGRYFFAISDNFIGQYHKFNGTHVRTYKTDFKHFNGGIQYNGNLYLTHNPKGENTVEIFSIVMEHLGSLPVPHPGSLTWIDRFQDKWWGVLAFYKDEVEKTRLVRFEDNWEIDREWEIPKPILDKLYPWSISGGQFHKQSGLLFMTGHNKREIYITWVDQEDPRKEKLDLIDIIPAPIEGQGINFDGDYLWGIRRSTREVIISKLEYI